MEKNYKHETREQLISHCRYYHGEKECPFDKQDEQGQNRGMLWFYESCWVCTILSSSAHYNEMVDEYCIAGLKDFESKDGIPISLKALLFNRYGKCAQCMQDAVEPFKEFYHTYYTSIKE